VNFFLPNFSVGGGIDEGHVNKNYTVDYILDAADLHVFEDNKFDFVITIHVLEYLTNPIIVGCFDAKTSGNSGQLSEQ
jgi:predicted SAM-dependent methyltransferase